MRSFRGLAALVLAFGGLALVPVGASAAGNPDRQILPTPPDVVLSACGDAMGPILFHITVNREFSKTFVESDGTIKSTVNGASFASVTRLSDNKTLDFNISGNGYLLLTPTGQLIVGVARGPLIDINPPPSGGIWLYYGHTVFGDNGVVISHTGKVTDVCALLG